MVDAITSPTNSVTSLVSSLFQGKDAFKGGELLRTGWKVAEGMATSGMSKYFKSLTSSFMSARERPVRQTQQRRERLQWRTIYIPIPLP